MFYKNLQNIIIICIAVLFLPIFTWADSKLPNPDNYLPRPDQLGKYKKVIDDPRSLMDQLHPSKILPPEIWEKLHYDIDLMKSQWAEIVGFKSPDIVGKIAPEIKPGKYTYKDLEKHPGLKELLPPEIFDRVKPGGPPFAGDIPEFEIVPTQQYYWSLPICEMTKKSMGTTKLDKDGYIITESWPGGFPFPRPSGKFKAQQVFYNYVKRYSYFGNNCSFMGRSLGIDKNLTVDFDSIYRLDTLRLSRRVTIPPFGWYDKRAEKNNEFKSMLTTMYSPRDVKGTVILTNQYENIDKFNQNMIYIPSLRRVRKMSSTDTQDPMSGQDIIYDDNEGFSQKISPTRYPYKFEIIAEREYLFPMSTDGTEYIDSKDGYSLKNIKMERRPCYVVELTQEDSNYVYSKRKFYVDMETLMITGLILNYDQKGRLYRSNFTIFSFLPECGTLIANGAPTIQRDHIDLHSSCIQLFTPPAFWDRKRFSMQRMMKMAK